MMRLKPVLMGALIGCVALALAACGTPDPDDPTDPSETTTEPVDPASELPGDPNQTEIDISTTLDDVVVTGEFGEVPTVTFDAPWKVDVTIREVLVEGDGPIVPQRGYVQVNYYGINARTGELFDDSYSKGLPLSLDLAYVVPGFQKGLSGLKAGSRVVIAMTGADGYDGTGGNEEAGIEIGDSLIFVVDVLRTATALPNGEVVPVNDLSLPTVTGNIDNPKVTIPNTKAPTQLVVQQLIIGEGPEIVESDVIQIQYAEYIWDDSKMVRTTYLYAPLQGALADTIAGWQEGLLGQTIGSRLMLVVPPDKAYPKGNPKEGIPEGSTMVYVIDILYAASS